MKIAPAWPSKGHPTMLLRLRNQLRIKRRPTLAIQAIADDQKTAVFPMLAQIRACWGTSPMRNRRLISGSLHDRVSPLADLVIREPFNQALQSAHQNICPIQGWKAERRKLGAMLAVSVDGEPFMVLKTSVSKRE
jgi:hypothetical protein